MANDSKAKYEADRPKVMLHARVSRECLFFIRMIAAHDNKPQGEIIEEWARAGYAWRLYGNKSIRKTRGLISSLKQMCEWDLKHGTDTFFSKMFRFGNRMPLYSKQYYYFRRAWDRFRINLAAGILALTKLLNRITSR